MTIVSSSGLNAINAKDGSTKYVHSITTKEIWTAMLSIYALSAV
jgi:hypothetical protein